MIDGICFFFKRRQQKWKGSDFLKSFVAKLEFSFILLGNWWRKVYKNGVSLAKITNIEKKFHFKELWNKTPNHQTPSCIERHSMQHYWRLLSFSLISSHCNLLVNKKKSEKELQASFYSAPLTSAFWSWCLCNCIIFCYA